jgi:hypothetical protein
VAGIHERLLCRDVAVGRRGVQASEASRTRSPGAVRRRTRIWDNDHCRHEPELPRKHFSVRDVRDGPVSYTGEER